MATTLYMSGVSLIVQYLTNLGVLAQGGQLTTYVGGSPSTPVTTYTDSTGLVANTNPMTLSAGGRPASASGAPVAFWVPGGTSVKLVVTDAGGNQLVNIDNIPAFNDLTNASNSLQTLLASPASSNATAVGPVAGADLVANAVKSYDVFADVRTANVPTLASGQTLNISVQGGNSVGDGLGGDFYWSSSSSAADDGLNVLNPSANAGNGRYLRLYRLGGSQVIEKTADQQITNSTVITADTKLTAPLAANATYLVSLRLQLLGQGGTGQGYKINVGFTGALTNGGAGGGVASGNAVAAAVVNQQGTTFTQAAINQTNNDVFNVDYILVVGTAGQLTVAWAQNTGSANATIMKAGSTMTITRLA